MGMRLELPTWTSISRRSITRKPEICAFSVYVPGGIAGMTYSPALLVTTSRTAFVAALVSVTVTPGTADPLGSTTTPLMSPVGVWARAGTTSAAATMARTPTMPSRDRALTDLRNIGTSYVAGGGCLYITVWPVTEMSVGQRPVLRFWW